MSIKATSWAWELDDRRLKPTLFLVLLAICDAAHEDRNFECVLKHSTIAAKAKISDDSVARQIAQLRAYGYLHVVKHRGEDGKQLTNRYIVLMTDAARRHAYSLGWDGAIDAVEERSEERTDAGADMASRPAICGSDRPANQGEPTRKFDEADPHCCGSVIDDFNESNDSPSKAPEAFGERGASRDFEKRTAEGAPASRGGGAEARIARWDVFAKAWPWDALEGVEFARQKFMQLTDDEQIGAVEGGPRYIAECKARGRMIAHAKTYLAGKSWQSRKARSVESAAALGGAGFNVMFGTAQFWRWLDYHQAVRDVRLSWRDRRDGSASAQGRENAVLMPMLFELRGGKGFWRQSEWPPPIAGGAARAGPEGAAA
ncbi:helix-turn-helix domain-containing protein [Methylosinus sp. LW4]|uniref:helix-turn-helix domain-containing protein n=1 Tax=Methylosinus sp. LW4 TaxID=136993 RepID=UPI00036480D2|nr:helix-turn-helix domain-containing protein [Methylosinus sp. LW4]